MAINSIVNGETSSQDAADIINQIRNVAESALQPGQVTVADIQADGTPDGTNFLRGDGIWIAVSGGGTVMSVIAGTGLSVNAADPANPVVEISSATMLAISSAVQPGDLGSAAFQNVGDFATSMQGSLAETAVQPGSLGTAAYENANVFATAAQGALATTSVQPARSISAGTGLTGGGNLSANRTIALSADSIASLDKADTSLQPGEVTIGDLDVGGTASSSTFLRGDGTWAVPVGGGGGVVNTVAAGTGITVNSADPVNPVVALSAGAQASLDLADTSVQPTRSVSTGTGLTGGGTLAANRTIALSTASIASLAKADTALQSSDVGSAAFANTGDFATAAQGALAGTAVQPARTISAGTGLTGGGSLAANRSIALSAASIASLAKADTSLQPEIFGVQTVNVSSISSGVLTLPANGDHFVLAGHGAADYTISGFGANRPAGRTHTLLVPRTIGDTGGTPSSMGRTVSFAHAASGAGLDMRKNLRIVNGLVNFTYVAYPDACNTVGDSMALYEELKFVSLGSGRYRLIDLPNPVMTQYEGGDDYSVTIRRADGTQEHSRVTSVTVAASTSQTDKSIAWTALFIAAPFVSATPLSAYGNSLSNAYMTIRSEISGTLRVVNTRNTNNAAGKCWASVTATGLWK